MKQPSKCVVENQAKALDKIHQALATKPEGLTARQLADECELGIGYVEQILKSSEICIRRKQRGSDLWIADWSEVDENFRPSGVTVIKRPGRPRVLKNRI